MKRTRFSLIMAAAALALALSACAEGPVGIFASVAAETDINKHATKEFRGTSPSFVAKLDVSGTDYYYAGIGGLYRRTTGATSWDKVDTSAAGSSKYVATSGVVNSGTDTLYVTFADPDTKNVIGVFSFNGTTWARVDGSFPVTGEKLRHVLLANNQLFAVTAVETLEDDVVTKTEHKVYRLNGAAFAVSTGAGPLEIGLPNAIAYDGTDYWFSAGTSTLDGPDNNLTKETRSVQLGGVFADATGLFFSGRDGRIYEWDDPDWKASAAFEDYNDRPYSFGIPVVVDDPSGNSTLLVPSRAYPQGTVRDQGLGYLEFDAVSFDTDSAAIADKSRRVSTLNNYFITLDGKSVKQILAFDESGDATHERLFALTDGDGLWSNQWQGGSWSGWRRE